MRCSVLVLFLLFSFTLFGQWDDSTEFKKNQITFNIGLHSFFDGGSMLQAKYAGKRKFWFNNSYGINYIRAITKNDFLALDYSYYLHQYLDDGYGSKEPGDIDFRNAHFISINYLRKVFNYNRFSIFALGGLQYRHGDEHFANYYYGGFELSTSDVLLRDVGANIGGYVSFRTVLGFTINTQFSYSYYIYRKVREGYASYNDGSTRHMFMINLGLGYNFGNK